MFGSHLPLYLFSIRDYFLTEPFTVLVRDGCYISREKIQMEMAFNRHVATQGSVLT
jgi:hypothetical protein